MAGAPKRIDRYFDTKDICEVISSGYPDGRFDDACSAFLEKNESAEFAPLDFVRHLKAAGLPDCARAFLSQMIVVNPGRVSRIYQ